MKILLLQLDGKMPNIALMRLAAHHHGDDVEFRRAGNLDSLERELWDAPDKVYASAIFQRSRPLCQRLLAIYPDATIGGSGWDEQMTVEKIGVTTKRQDYSIYPDWQSSIGYTQRGCRFKCAFCVVPRMEGAVSEENTIADIWRGKPWPRELILLDNDFFGQSHWRERIAEIRDGGFKVCFSQGINCRTLSDEAAAAIASVNYRSWRMNDRRLYTAWDNRGDESPLFRGLEALKRNGVNPHDITVYMLIGFWPGETASDREYRRKQLRDWGAEPYPMPFVRTKELVGFQRWVLGAYDKRVPWDKWEAAGYEPRKLGVIA